MANIRCPMCGKSNPAEAETCVYCQARLRPLEETPAEPPKTKPKRRARGGTARLQRVGLGDESPPESSEPEAEPEATPTPEEETPSEENPPAGSGGTAWLRRIGLGDESPPESSEPEAEPEATPAPEEETPSEENPPAGSGGTSWLRRIGLGEESPPESPEPEAEPEATPAPDEETPLEENPPAGSGGTSWLRRIGLGDESSSPEPSETVPEAEPPPPADEETPLEENLPAGSGGTTWLRRIGLVDEPSPEPSEAETEPEATPAPEEETFSEESAPPEEPSGETAPETETASPEVTLYAAGDFPAEGALANQATPAPEEATLEEPIEEPPLASAPTEPLGKEAAVEESEQPHAEEEPLEEPGTASAPTEPLGKEAAVEESEQPLAEEEPLEEPGAASAPTEPLGKEVPETVSEQPLVEEETGEEPGAASAPTEPLGKEAPVEESQQPLAKGEPVEEAPTLSAQASLEESGPEETEPESLAAEETQEEGEPEVLSEEPAAQEETGGRPPALPDWLLALAGTPRPEGETPAATPEAPTNEEIEEALQPLAEEGMLGWEDAGVPEEESAEVPEAPSLAPGLAPAELPPWLEALRPSRPSIPAETVEEGSGPLAGLSGILPAEGIAPSYRKPVEASLDFQVSERQRLQAVLFEQMLAGEARPAASVAAQRPSASGWLRLVVALLLIGLVLASLWMGGLPLANLQPAAPAAVGDFYQQLEAVPPGTTVLLAAEYDPGFAAEMHFTAQAALERLMQKQVNLVSISTLPAGPVLAQQLLQTAYDDLLVRDPASGAYALAERTANLGYLPGGTTSLQEFAQRPQQVTGYVPAWSGSAPSAWESPALARINQVSDFALVIVLTDKIENGQAWIEQVAPALNGAPLLLVSSAQAAPLLQPYLASEQAQGMLAGLADGQALAQLQGVGNGAARWSAYQYGLLLAVLLALLGALFQAFRRQSQSGGQA